jgi:hypothetical protein
MAALVKLDTLKGKMVRSMDPVASLLFPMMLETAETKSSQHRMEKRVEGHIIVWTPLNKKRVTGNNE